MKEKMLMASIDNRGIVVEQQPPTSLLQLQDKPRASRINATRVQHHLLDQKINICL